ncbi:SUN domain-containing protein [Apis cerana cerana]|uniref:SUN domain-containing protein n=1 Tax=Apis cerana cerana TaxID=94128 RepID=A0A2A3E284_APICC|nr:SUN domain-containing protein [Apis cerana cerana]
MENEQRHYELRSGSRSRSRTPLIQTTLIEPETLEHHYDLRSQSREKSYIPGEIANNKKSGFKISSSNCNKTNDQEITIEKKKEVTIETLEHESKQFENSSINIKKGECQSKQQKAKEQVFANGQTDNKEVSFGYKKKKHRTFTSDYSSEETEQEESDKSYSAHEIYKKAGDWWNVFPKTDYTYSETSKCRYEIAPGILAMPNMSRRSIHSNMKDSNQFLYDPSDICETRNVEEKEGTKVENYTPINEMNEFYGAHMPSLDSKSKIQYTKMHVKQYCSHRQIIYAKSDNSKNWESRQLLYSDLPSKRINFRKYDITSSLDSDAELEETVPKNCSQRNKITQQFMSFILIIVLWFNKFLEFLKLKTVKRREYYATYEYQKYGSWYLVHLLRFFPVTKVITQYFGSELVVNDKQLFLKEEMFEKNNFQSIIEKLYNKINNLEDQTMEKPDQLSDIIQVLQWLKTYSWSQSNNEILFLEKKLKEYKLDDIHAQIDIIKSQLEKLNKFYSELKCCNTYMNHIINKELEKHIEMVLIDHADILISKIEKVKDQDKSWIASNNLITDDRVREIVKEAIKIYDADKTGRVDYALESAGGQIISTRCTQKYDIKTRAFKVLAFFTLYHENNNPRTVIQGNPIQPGTCWAFQGFPGYLLIKLRSSIYITGFTVEHAPKSILPNSEMRSAPRKFNVWGFLDENDSEPVLFGDYEFVGSDNNLQYFPVKNTAIKTPYEYVELRVHSNHGQLEYTCLYRFRVHGKSV